MSALHFVKTSTSAPACGRYYRSMVHCTGFAPLVTCKRCLAAMLAETCRRGHAGCKACGSRASLDAEGGG